MIQSHHKRFLQKPTHRLNRLIHAYREAKRMVGEANRGRAIMGVAMRWCHKIRQAIKAEIIHVLEHLGRTQ